MYQALYRKYRPNNFDEVVGQEVVVKILKNSILNNKVSHAYLFSGPRGTGKTSLAKIFAKIVNCSEPKNLSPCNNCVSCTQINNKQSTDIIEIDAASNNGVDEIRELKSKVSLVPNVSKYKVYIIDEVHMLTIGAFNALLKTLEEPPSHAIFILATTEIQKIPITILSRCQRLDFKKIPEFQIGERLKEICIKEKINITDSAISEISRISDGGMRDSISILDQVITYKNNGITEDDVHLINGTITQKDLEEFIDCLLKSDVQKIFDLLDKYNSQGKNIGKLLDEIILYLRNVLLYKKVPNYLIKNNINIEPYKNISTEADVNYIYKLITSFNELNNKIKISNNPKLLFEIEILNNLKMENQNEPEAKNISREIKTVKKEKIQDKKIMDKYNEEMSNVRKVRINNTLSNLNKKNIIEIKNKRTILNKYLLDSKFSKYISLLLDGTIKAASDEYIVYVYDSIYDSTLFNDNLLILENILNKSLKLNFKLISTSMDAWKIIKNSFNNKEKDYVYEKEQFDINKIYQEINTKALNDDMIVMFDNIIEYTEEDIK